MLQNRSWHTFQAPGWFAEDRVAARYEADFAQVNWEGWETKEKGGRRGRLPHPTKAYAQAFWVMVAEQFRCVSQLWRYLGEHPALVWLLGFRLAGATPGPYGFDLGASLPTARHLRRVFARLPQDGLRQMLAQTVQQAVKTIPEFGQVVSLDVKHIYAYVAENNPRQDVADRFNPARRLKADPDCRVGWKAHGNQQDPATTRDGEWLWGYGTGIAVSRTPEGDALVIAEQTQPFNALDITYGRPLLNQVSVHLGFPPHDITADAAFDAFFMYEERPEGGIAAIPLNLRGHRLTQWTDRDLPLCAAGHGEMMTKGQVYVEKGRHVRRFQCPVCQTTHKLVVELGARLRARLDRRSERYRAVYQQRTAVERINSLAAARGIARPLQRRLAFIARRNTMIYLVLNVHALQRYHQRSLKHPLSSLPP